VLAKYFGIIYFVFLVVATAAIISLVFDNQLVQYLSILAMIGLCTAYVIIAIFDCSTKAHILLFGLKNIVSTSKTSKANKK
jgi:hypothetical protein